MTFSVQPYYQHLAAWQVAHYYYQRLDKDFKMAFFRIDLQLLVALHHPLLVIHYPLDQ
tara:strand:+ start:170 stop:343 length:174 start_codon:yes stop_codon:yes gene_type:complete